MIGRAREFFQTHGVELHFSDSALAALAERGAAFGTGARALERIVTEVLEPVVWRMFESPRVVRRIDITDGAIRGLSRERFHYRDGESRLQQSDLWKAGAGDAGIPSGRVQTHTAEWYRQELKRLLPRLRFDDASEPAQKWWLGLATGKLDRSAMLYSVASAVVERGATLEDLFKAYRDSESGNPAAVLHYLDYLRARSS